VTNNLTLGYRGRKEKSVTEKKIPAYGEKNLSPALLEKLRNDRKKKDK